MSDKIRRYIRYPIHIPSPELTRVERCMLRLGHGVARCNVCGDIALFLVEHKNLRETCICKKCGATNRQRQVAFVVCGIFSQLRSKHIKYLRDFSQLEDLVVYNTEARGPIHKQLSRMKHYVCSEFADPSLESGTTIHDVLHEDLMKLSFAEDSIDLVISSDVFEHVSDPYAAHKEVHRVLKKGGRHVFTVPFYQNDFLDEVRATTGSNGRTLLVKEPEYHDDPLRGRDASLVYTIFSLEMLCKLRRLGFRTNLYHLRRSLNGILGPNAIVFEAIKD